MHLMTSPLSEPHTRHQHCTPLPASPLPSSAACLPGHPTALPACSVPPVLPSPCLSVGSFGTGASLECSHNTPLCGEMRCRCLGVFGGEGKQPPGPPHTGWTVPMQLQVRAPALPSGEQSCAQEPFTSVAPSLTPWQHKHWGPHSSGAGGTPAPHTSPSKAPWFCLLSPGWGRDPYRGCGTSTAKTERRA